MFGGEVLRWSHRLAAGTWASSSACAWTGWRWLFALLISGIGALVVLYAGYYLDRDDPAARFFVFLLLFMGAMLGVVLADNLILLVVFWELTSLSSFLLIGYWSHRPTRARARAWRSPSPAAAGCACSPACC